VLKPEIRYEVPYTITLYPGAGVHASVGTIRALVPLYTIPPSLPIEESRAQSRFDTQEQQRDGIVYVGYESHRIRGEYLPSGKMMGSSPAPGRLIDIYV